jgi:trehalose-phosphatase
LKSLYLNLNKILAYLNTARHLIVFLDYDGTLAPIADSPKQAFMPKSMRRALTGLVKNKRIFVHIVSGRTVKEVKPLVGIKGVSYAGCHGLDMQGAFPAGYGEKLKKARCWVKNIKRRLVEELKAMSVMESIDIEDKGIILSLHYRRAVKGKRKGLIDIFRKSVKPCTDSGDMVIVKNKMVIELKPAVNWDKGAYCLYVLNNTTKKHKPVLPIYIGDDNTDETAFRALKDKGITVFVKGEKSFSDAEYYLNSIDEVQYFLNFLAANAH